MCLQEMMEKERIERKILNAYLQGYKYKEIANKFSTNTTRVGYVLRKYNFNKKICPCCSKEFKAKNMKQKYCSVECLRRQSRRNNRYKTRCEHKHNDIVSLKRLYERDKGRCHICGKPTNWNDYKHNDDGWFIAGKNYPSVDHVIPLSKGGTNTYDNCKLAHCYCNSIKGNKVSA